MISYAKTDTGLVGRSNQDFLFAADQPVGPLPNLFIVADGMGGHKAGDFASRLDCLKSRSLIGLTGIRFT